MPFESLEHTLPDQYKRVMSVQSILNKYKIFTRAQNLGIVFGPKDISVNELIYFEAIRDKLDEAIRSNTGGK